ncbi:hypothetical protein Q4578_18025 [Shimia thalassica]|uniref:hypothetical protein n=1 Tax=Shimia thalassica TaxID=1715693 RepID=UPI0026E2A360|nr:hypothetical protein [Shimia thalassica]MDO6523497.1 hypothetical protein [Shimia thalassica]
MSEEIINDELVREIARVMFINQQHPDADTTKTQEAWRESRVEHKKNARRFLKTLERRGKVTLGLVPEIQE